MKQLLLPVLLLAVSLVGVGCGDAATPAGKPSCTQILEACHPVDPGIGPLHDCHETAVSATSTEASCAAVSASCIAMCNAAGADAGSADLGASDMDVADMDMTDLGMVNEAGVHMH